MKRLLLVALLNFTFNFCFSQSLDDIERIEVLTKMVDTSKIRTSIVIRQYSNYDITLERVLLYRHKNTFVKITEIGKETSKSVTSYYFVDKHLIKVVSGVQDEKSEKILNKRDFYFNKNKPIYISKEDKNKNAFSYKQFLKNSKDYNREL